MTKVKTRKIRKTIEKLTFYKQENDTTIHSVKKEIDAEINKQITKSILHTVENDPLVPIISYSLEYNTELNKIEDMLDLQNKFDEAIFNWDTEISKGIMFQQKALLKLRIANKKQITQIAQMINEKVMTAARNALGHNQEFRAKLTNLSDAQENKQGIDKTIRGLCEVIEQQPGKTLSLIPEVKQQLDQLDTWLNLDAKLSGDMDGTLSDESD